MPLTQFTGRILRVVVFALLLTSAMVGIFLSERLWDLWQVGSLPLWAPLGPPISFFAFMVVFALDRLHAVQQRHLPVSRAMFQVGTTVVFFMLLLPHAGGGLRPWRPRARPQQPLARELAAPAQLLLGHDDDAVRAATCMLIGAQTPSRVTRRGQSVLTELLTDRAHNDPALLVRQACTAALVRLEGHHGPGPTWPDRSVVPPGPRPAPEGPHSPDALGDENDEEDGCDPDDDPEACDEEPDGSMAL